MAIEWKPGREVIGAEASVGGLRLIVTPHGQGFRWYVLVNVGIIGSLSLVPVLGGSGQASEIAEGRRAAEQFAREWIAAQAAALGDGWIPVETRLPENGDGWYHVAVHDYKGRYPRHAIAQFTCGRFWIDGDDGEGDSVFAWRGPALPPLPATEAKP